MTKLFAKTNKLVVQSLSKKAISKLIPQRKIDANKGDFGHVLIIGGEYGMGGAVIMAAEAACRAGAGRVTVVTRKEHVAPLLARVPNVMTAQIEDKNDWSKIIKNKTVIAIGPGLGKTAWSLMLFGLVMESNLPKVIDADALNLLSESEHQDFNLQNAVLTPHPGEASRLLGCSVEAIQNDRQNAIIKLQQKYLSNIVLKGHNSLILAKEQKLILCPYGNPGMAVAGMGDVLTGIIVALIAQNLEINLAAVIGVYIHALAGDKVAKEQGQIGIMPSDVINKITTVLN